MRGALNEIGFAGVIIALRLADGTLQACDGHLRDELMGDALVPVAVTDLANIFTDWRMWGLLADTVEATGQGVRSMLVWDNPLMACSGCYICGEQHEVGSCAVCHDSFAAAAHRLDKAVAEFWCAFSAGFPLTRFARWLLVRICG